MKNILKLILDTILGNKAWAGLSVIVTIILTFFPLQEEKNTHKIIESNKTSQSTQGNNSPIINTKNGSVTINYLEKEKHDTWLRMKYTICTGPYNHREEMFGRTSESTSRDGKFLMKNNVFNNLSRLKVLPYSSAGGVLTYQSIEGKKNINKTFGIKNLKSSYQDFFSQYDLDIKKLKNKNLLPPYIKEILIHNPTFNEKIHFYIGDNPHTNDITLYLYYRSLRTKSVIIENISNHIIKDIVIQVKVYEPKNKLEIRQGKNRDIDNKFIIKKINFPLNRLKPNESIVFPLEIKMVSPQFASGYIYESENKLDILNGGFSTLMSYSEDKNTYHAKLASKEEVKNILKESKEHIFFLNNDIEDAIDIGSKYKILNVSFNIDGSNEKQIYKRDLNINNLIYVNDNCECGSCPTLFAKNENNNWRRLREIITEYNSKEKSGKFSYVIPTSSNSIKIKEYKGETSFFQKISVMIKTKSGNTYLHPIDKNQIIVSHDTSLTISLRKIKKSYENDSIIQINITGEGYYLTKSKTICPPVIPLTDKLFKF